ncbi:MAG: hypothetical protein H7Z75_10655 [Ferruginibacter sp.]|nr:hypothetical protein [Cytophagales bacterium]
MKNHPWYLLAPLLALSSELVAGGGWTQPRHNGYFKLESRLLRARNYYNAGGGITDITTTSLYTTSLYGEYGLTDRLTAIVYFPFVTRLVVNKQSFRPSGFTVPGDAATSVGDTDVSLKFGIIRNKPLVLSASLTLGIPFGRVNAGDTKILTTGDGEFNQLVKVEAGLSFPGGYAAAVVGFNNRTRSFSDEFHYGLEVGTSVKRFSGLVRLYAVQSLFNGSAGERVNSVFSNNVEYISYGPELAYTVRDKFGVTAAAAFAAAGKNILAAPTYSVGVFLKLKK